MRKRLVYLAKWLGAAVLLAAVLALGLNYYVKSMAAEHIYQPDALPEKSYDCILILGCGVLPNGEPTAMLKDRLLRGIELYEDGAAPKLLVSGDHGQNDYDEVNTMKDFLIKAGVPSEDIFMDHAGFSTYESIYRARDIFRAQTVIIVTQEYHLYRALYLAEALDLGAVGVSADLRNYRGQAYRELREIAARDKDFIYAVLKPLPTYLGEAIPVNGDGDLTNDQN